jgi:predicted dehydrogenase
MVRILQVGVGIRGSHWAEYVRDHPDTEGVAFVDTSSDSLARARELGGAGARCFQDLDEAIESVEADAALIASPSRFHAEHAARALQAGLAVMIEKPFAETVEDAAGVLRAAEASGRPVLVAENYRYWPAERTVRELIADGAIGLVDHATLVDRRNMPAHTEGPWVSEMQYAQLQEIAIHHFDSLRFMLDQRPREMAVRVWNPPRSDYRHGANTEALIGFDTARVQYVGTLTSHRFGFALWIEGESGAIWTNRKYVFLRRGSARIPRPVRNVAVPAGDGSPYPKGGTTSLLNALRDAVEHGTIPETNGADNIWNVAMVEAGKLADSERRTVAIEEVYRPPEAHPSTAG